MDAIFKKKNQAIFQMLDNFRNISRNPFERMCKLRGVCRILVSTSSSTEKIILKS